MQQSTIYRPNSALRRTPSLTVNLERETKDSFFWQHRKSFLNLLPKRESSCAFENDSVGCLSLSKKDFCCLTPMVALEQSPTNTRTNFLKLKKMLNAGSMTKNKSLVEILRKSSDSNDEQNEKSKEKQFYSKKRGASMILERIFNQAKTAIQEIERQNKDESLKIQSCRNKENQFVFNYREPRSDTKIFPSKGLAMGNEINNADTRHLQTGKMTKNSFHKSSNSISMNRTKMNKTQGPLNRPETSSLRMRCYHGHQLHICPSCTISKTLTLKQGKSAFR